MNDKQIMEKMDELDALSAGVVFGKEEAWDKLQARMDKKPTRKIVLWYKVAAAAAILLLCLSIGVAYYTPEKQIAKTQLPKPIQQEIESTPSTEIAAITPQPEKSITQERKHPNQKQISRKRVVTVKELKGKIQTVDPLLLQPATIAAAATEPVKPTIKKMRVVHINDLDNTNKEEPAYAVHKGPSLDIRKMKVVSIYDVQREEYQLRYEQDVTSMAYYKQPRSSFFPLPSKLNFNSDNNETPARNPLRLQLNNNNQNQ